MSTPAASAPLWFIGPGRLGLALGERLRAAGFALACSGRHAAPPSHPLFASGDDGVRWLGTSLTPPGSVAGVLLTVPDDALPALAARLADDAALPADVPVLHASGALGAEVLAPLRARGHPVGALHPLAAVPRGAGAGERLRGAAFAFAGDAGARALAEHIAAACAGALLDIDPGAKSRYHAAAVFASNYLVVLLDVAERLMRDAGVAPAAARAALTSLARGAVSAVAEQGAGDALTGPIARGDMETVRTHLRALPPELRPLYSLLGSHAIDLAERSGLPPERAATLAALLAGDMPRLRP